MSVDFKRLIDLRELRERTALQRFGEEQRQYEHSRAQAEAARLALQQRQRQKVAHWEASLQGLGHAAGGVGRLKDADAWALQMQLQIEQAQRDLQLAESLTAERQTTLEEARRRLHEAAIDTHKARELAQRLQLDRVQRRERRLEGASDDSAAQAWAARRAS
ncbi:MAG: hypothetical protein AB1430_14635 [Pseudomonadota bacterium]